MLALTQRRASTEGLTNIRAAVRDVLTAGYGYGVPKESLDAVLLMNILHCEEPVAMLREAASVLKPGCGRLYATHWRYDPSTPRGPPMNIRPQPGQLEEWASATGMLQTERGAVDCPPWHYGFVFARI